MRKLLFISLLLSLTLSNVVVAKTNANAVPGGIAIVDFKVKAGVKPLAYFGGKKVLLLPGTQPYKNEHFDYYGAVVGLPLTLETGMHDILVFEGKSKKKYSFKVSSKEYAAQKINLRNKRTIEPNPEDLERAKQEAILVHRIVNHYKDVPVYSVSLIEPINGRKSAVFGLRREFNGILKNRHRGLDLAAPKGTNIKAAKAGVVVLADDLFYTGNTVIIEHGQGLFTIYCHMNDISVDELQVIKTGEVIGTVGQTGRATGPHLHFGVSLNGTRVDPEVLL